MPRTAHLSTDQILRFLQLKNSPVSEEDISRGLHLGKTDRRPLLKMLSKLKKRNAIEQMPGGRYQLARRRKGAEAVGQPGPEDEGDHPRRGGQAQASPRQAREEQTRDSGARTNEVKGRLVSHHDGYGFVVPDVPVPNLDRDIFIPRDGVEDAMHGDHVLVKIIRLSTDSSGEPRAEGRIIRVLDRAHPTVVGLFRYGSRGNVVLPYDPRIQHEIEIPPGQELTP